MASTRENKVSRMLQRELGEYFQRESRRLFDGKMITVTHVRISPDLVQARVYLSVFLTGEKEKFIQYVNSIEGQIRFEIGKKIRHQVRKIPEFTFFLDDSLDYIDNIDRLLNEDE